MSTAESTPRNTPLITPIADWKVLQDAYHCGVLLCAEEEGGFSAFCLNLPGVVSQGESEDEALKNIADAFSQTIAAYRNLGDAIPWGISAEVERAADSKERWIVVNVSE